MPTVRTDTGQTPRVDALPKVTGRAIYTEDLPLPPGALYGAILRSQNSMTSRPRVPPASNRRCASLARSGG